MNRNEAEAVIRDTIEYANGEIARNKKRSRRILAAVLAAALLIIAVLAGCLISYVTFGAGNPFSAAGGLFQITVLDKEYAQIQGSPRVVLAQPKAELLEEYMEARGFTELKDEQMGAIRVFTNGAEKELVWYRQNRHCLVWRWE